MQAQTLAPNQWLNIQHYLRRETHGRIKKTGCSICSNTHYFTKIEFVICNINHPHVFTAVSLER